jgi:hypothetical protein
MNPRHAAFQANYPDVSQLKSSAPAGSEPNHLFLCADINDSAYGTSAFAEPKIYKPTGELRPPAAAWPYEAGEPVRYCGNRVDVTLVLYRNAEPNCGGL